MKGAWSAECGVQIRINNAQLLGKKHDQAFGEWLPRSGKARTEARANGRDSDVNRRSLDQHTDEERMFRDCAMQILAQGVSAVAPPR